MRSKLPDIVSDLPHVGGDEERELLERFRRWYKEACESLEISAGVFKVELKKSEDGITLETVSEFSQESALASSTSTISSSQSTPEKGQSSAKNPLQLDRDLKAASVKYASHGPYHMDEEDEDFHNIFSYLWKHDWLRECKDITLQTPIIDHDNGHETRKIGIHLVSDKEDKVLEMQDMFRRDKPVADPDAKIVWRYNLPDDGKGIDCVEPKLHEAVRQCDVVSIEDILKAGADINEQDSDGYTPLMIAAGVIGDPLTTDMLIQWGALVDVQGKKDKETAVHLASGRGLLTILRMLLRANLHSVFMKDKTGRTPLHAAARAGSWTCAEMIWKVMQLLSKHSRSPSINTSPEQTTQAKTLITDQSSSTAYISPTPTKSGTTNPLSSLTERLCKAQEEFAYFLNKENRRDNCGFIQGFYVNEVGREVLVVDVDKGEHGVAETLMQEFITSDPLKGLDFTSEHYVILEQEHQLKECAGLSGLALNVGPLRRVDGQTYDPPRPGKIGCVVKSNSDVNLGEGKHVQWTDAKVAMTCCHLISDERVCAGMVDGTITQGNIGGNIPMSAETQCVGINGVYQAQVHAVDSHYPKVDIALVKINDDNNNAITVDEFDGYFADDVLYFKKLVAGHDHRYVAMLEATVDDRESAKQGFMYNSNYTMKNDVTMMFEKESIVIHPTHDQKGGSFAEQGDSGAMIVFAEGYPRKPIGIITQVREGANTLGQDQRVNQTFAVYLKNCIDALRQLKTEMPSMKPYPHSEEGEIQQVEPAFPN